MIALPPFTAAPTHPPTARVAWRGVQVRAALLAEADTFPAESVDPYFFGTQIAQLGRLAVIADELGEAAVRCGGLVVPAFVHLMAAVRRGNGKFLPALGWGWGWADSQARLVLAQVAARVRARMQVLLTPWLEGQNRDALLYDTTWGGIISTEGLEVRPRACCMAALALHGPANAAPHTYAHTCAAHIASKRPSAHWPIYGS